MPFILAISLSRIPLLPCLPRAPKIKHTLLVGPPAALASYSFRRFIMSEVAYFSSVRSRVYGLY